MDRNDFGGAVIPAMAGFFLFGKRAKAQEIQEEKPKQLPVVTAKSEASDGITGVTRYLLSAPLITGVAKYVKKAEKQHMSGVSKYVLRQSLAKKNTPITSGVAKYIAKSTVTNQPRKSSVDNYLAAQERLVRNSVPFTGVARYEATQTLIERKKLAAELIEKYRIAEQDAVKAAQVAAVLAYEVSSASSNHEQMSELEDKASTRVGRYLKEQEANGKSARQATTVSKYIARQIVIESQKPAKSKVEKYLQEQSIVERKKPKLTGVTKYLSKQPNTPKAIKPVEKLVESGVARYLCAQEELEKSKPVLSGVSKYIAKQVHSDIKSIPLIDNSVIEKCLEGEFIPASEYVPPVTTGVSRYLEKQEEVVVVAKETKSIVTGVSRYLEKQVESMAKSLENAPLTAVDRYLLKKAS